MKTKEQLVSEYKDIEKRIEDTFSQEDLFESEMYASHIRQGLNEEKQALLKIFNNEYNITNLTDLESMLTESDIT